MPNAAEYLAAVARLDEMANTAGSLSITAKATIESTGLVGETPVLDGVVADLQSAVSLLTNGQAAVAETANKLRWRAAVCDDYASEMTRWRHGLAMYNANNDGTSPKPVRPPKPYSWVEE